MATSRAQNGTMVRGSKGLQDMYYCSRTPPQARYPHRQQNILRRVQEGNQHVARG